MGCSHPAWIGCKSKSSSTIAELSLLIPSTDASTTLPNIFDAPPVVMVICGRANKNVLRVCVIS